MYNEHLTIVTPKLGMVYKVVSWEVARTILNDPEDHTDVYIYDGDDFTIVHNESEIDEAQKDNENKSACICVGNMDTLEKQRKTAQFVWQWRRCKKLALDENANMEDVMDAFHELSSFVELYDNYTCLSKDFNKVCVDGCEMHVESIFEEQPEVPTITFDCAIGNFEVPFEQLRSKAMVEVLNVVHNKVLLCEEIYAS